MPTSFSYKLTDTNIYGHLLYRIHQRDAKKIDRTGFLSVLKKAVKKANRWLNHADCNILVFADADKVIPEEGIGGLSWGSDWVRVDIDPNYKEGVAKAIAENMPGTITHELHHVCRSGR